MKLSILMIVAAMLLSSCSALQVAHCDSFTCKLDPKIQHPRNDMGLSCSEGYHCDIEVDFKTDRIPCGKDGSCPINKTPLQVNNICACVGVTSHCKNSDSPASKLNCVIDSSKLDLPDLLIPLVCRGDDQGSYGCTVSIIPDGSPSLCSILSCSTPGTTSVILTPKAMFPICACIAPTMICNRI